MRAISFLFSTALMLGVFTPFSADIYAPSLSFIATDLQASIDQVQWSMVVFLTSVAVSLLIYGPISEGLGRKPPLLFGLILSLIAIVICITASHIYQLYFGRFIQGIGAGACASVWHSLFRDVLSGKKLSKFGGYLTIWSSIIIAIAPILGGVFQTYFDWRASFYFLFALTAFILIFVLKFYDETHLSQDKKHLNFKTAYANYKYLMQSRVFLNYMMCTFLCYGALISWFVLGPVLIIDTLNMNPVSFGWITFVGGGMTMICASIFYAYLVKTIDTKQLLVLGLNMTLIAGLLMIILYLIMGVHLMAILLPMILFYFGTSFVWSSIFVNIFQPFGHMAGYTGSLYSFMQISGGAIIGAIISYLPDINQLPIAICMIIAASGSLMITRYVPQIIK